MLISAIRKPKRPNSTPTIPSGTAASAKPLPFSGTGSAGSSPSTFHPLRSPVNARPRAAAAAAVRTSVIQPPRTRMSAAMTAVTESGTSATEARAIAKARSARGFQRAVLDGGCGSRYADRGSCGSDIEMTPRDGG